MEAAITFMFGLLCLLVLGGACLAVVVTIIAGLVRLARDS